MSKSDFLERLKSHLIEGMSEREVLDILFKYEEYLRSSMAEGISEHQAVAILGSPQGIAEEFITHYKQMGETANKRFSAIDNYNLKFNRKLLEVRSFGSKKQILKFNRFYAIILSLLFILTLLLIAVVSNCVIVSCLSTLAEIKKLTIDNIELLPGVINSMYILVILVFEFILLYGLSKFIKKAYNFFMYSIRIIKVNKTYVKTENRG